MILTTERGQVISLVVLRQREEIVYLLLLLGLVCTHQGPDKDLLLQLLLAAADMTCLDTVHRA